MPALTVTAIYLRAVNPVRFRTAETRFMTASTYMRLHCIAVTPEERKEREASNHPVFLVKLRESELILDSTASFMIHVHGNPNPEVKL